MAGKEFLVQSLSDIGFGDSAADVLDHLLTIESSADLTDYLSQLLGSDNVKELVENIGRFQRGETIEAAAAVTTTATKSSSPSQTEQAITTSKPASSSKTTNTGVKGVNKPNNRNQSNKPAKKSNNPNPQKAAAPAPKQPPKANQKQSGKVSPQKDPTPIEASSEAKGKDHTSTIQSKPIQKSRPPRGKAKFTCGCMGTFHKPLSNCLFCGRVACEKEGYNYCPYCGYLIERPPPSGSQADKHKQRLLSFDREYAQRTVVLDDQADFFDTQQSLNWMDSEERQEKLEEQEERLRQSQLRPKMKLEINL